MKPVKPIKEIIDTELNYFKQLPEGGNEAPDMPYPKRNHWNNWGDPANDMRDFNTYGTRFEHIEAERTVDSCGYFVNFDNNSSK